MNQATTPPFAPRYRVELVRDGESTTPVRRVETPETAAEIMRKHLGSVADEHGVVVLLDAQNFHIGTLTVGDGEVDSCNITRRKVLRPAIIHNAAKMIFGHNHLGKVRPSPQDLKYFDKLTEAAELMSIKLVDMLIIVPGTDELYSHRSATFSV
jgi:DNA repair protein RadC